MPWNYCFKLRQESAAEKLPHKDLHSLLCLQLLGCRQEGKLFLLQYNSGEWKISSSWRPKCQRERLIQKGPVMDREEACGLRNCALARGRQGALARGRQGKIQSWLRFARLDARKASKLHTYSGDAFKRDGGLPDPSLALQWHLTWIKYCMGAANKRKDQTTWQPPFWVQALWEIQLHLGEEPDSGDTCCSKPLWRSKRKTRMLAPGKTRLPGSLEEGTKVSTAVL